MPPLDRHGVLGNNTVPDRCVDMKHLPHLPHHPPPPKLSLWDPRQWLRAVLEINDTPHRIARGSAIGMFIALTPTVGMQMLEVAIVALICRPFFTFNIPAAIIAVWVSNPLTTIPIYWGLYVVGTWIVGPADITFKDFGALFHYKGWEQWLHTVKTLFIDIGKPMLVGTAIVATISAILTYPIVLRLAQRVEAIRARHAAHVAELHAKAQAAQEAASAHADQPTTESKDSHQS